MWSCSLHSQNPSWSHVMMCMGKHGYHEVCVQANPIEPKTALPGQVFIIIRALR